MSEKTIVSKLKEIFHLYKVGDKVKPEHISIMSEYMDPYINVYKKRRGKTTNILVKKSNYNTPVFWYENQCGETTTANIKKAVHYYKTKKININTKQMLIEACRTDIGDQIIQFKTEQRQKSDHCHVCNISILPGESETDHYPTSFNDILNIFLSTVDISTIKLTRYKHIRWSIEKSRNKTPMAKITQTTC
jgi:hypothetical protein